MSEVEAWRPVVGYEGTYSVSDMGRVRSEPRIIARKDGVPMSFRGRIMKQTAGRGGYLYVYLSLNCTERNALVAGLVAAAFIGPKPEGMDVCHNDGKRTANAAKNLRYDTRAGNFADKIVHGTASRGESHPRAKLTNADVMAIRRDPRENRFVARDYGVESGTIKGIKARLTWRHL
jgi:NUMOD4 motif/HNH endonuclease